ncbi:hypothetical protein GQ457_03G007180 [Hibiscus cannabinus]
MAAVDWKSLFGGGDEQTLEFFPTVAYEDSFAVEPPPELFNEGISDWKNALVGQFIGTTPNFVALKKTVDALWGKSSLAKVSIAGPNLYVFVFANATARDWVLENGPWHIQHKPLVLRKWEPNLKRLDFDLAKMPVWVQLFNVPLELFSRKGLSYISSALGVPLYMDSITASRERLEFAKVCIEVDAGRRLPRSIPVKLQDKTIVFVSVKIPWMPSSCSQCNTFGHSEKFCPLAQEKENDLEWRMKKDNPSTAGVDQVISEGAVLDQSEANDVYMETEGDVVVADAVADVVTVNLANVTVGKVVIPSDGFPPLQSPNLRKGRGKSGKHNAPVFASSMNKFEVLNGIDKEGLEPRKTRVASLGVANLLQELKAKKSDKVKAKGLEAGCSGGVPISL